MILTPSLDHVIQANLIITPRIFYFIFFIFLLFLLLTMHMNKRPSFVNFPIPFDHPYTIPTLVATVGASALLYYSLQASHKADLKEAIRQQVVQKRRHLKRKEDKFASLKIEHQFVNPFREWQQTHSLLESVWFWLGLYNNHQVPTSEKVMLLSILIE